MAETQQASIGYGGEVHLFDGTALYELREVKSFGQPTYERERVETTHLKSPAWRRQYITTFYVDSEIEVTLNNRPLSTTDTLLRAAVAAGDTRECLLVIPEDGVPVAQVPCTVKVTNYDPGQVNEDVMESTATLLVVTVDAIEAYAP